MNNKQYKHRTLDWVAYPSGDGYDVYLEEGEYEYDKAHDILDNMGAKSSVLNLEEDDLLALGFEVVGEPICIHESNGRAYMSKPIQYKCKKCGEFYRPGEQVVGEQEKTDDWIDKVIQDLENDVDREMVGCSRELRHTDIRASILKYMPTATAKGCNDTSVSCYRCGKKFAEDDVCGDCIKEIMPELPKVESIDEPLNIKEFVRSYFASFGRKVFVEDGYSYMGFKCPDEGIMRDRLVGKIVNELLPHTRVSTPCIHESDGMCYTSNPPQSKCKKCGEFYTDKVTDCENDRCPDCNCILNDSKYCLYCKCYRKKSAVYD